MINNNKSNIIVASFAVLVFAVMGFAVYTSYKTNSDKEQSVSSTSSNSISNSKRSEFSSSQNSSESVYSSENKSNESSSDLNTNQGGQVIVTGQRLEITESTKTTPTSDKIAKSIQESEFPKPTQTKAENTPVSNNGSNSNVVVVPPRIPAPTPESPKADSNVYVYRAPVSPAPVPTPIVNQRYQSFLNAVSRLKSRGSNILVPIVNNNIYALSIESDADLYNVVEYEHLINGSQKGYGAIGTKAHLETLKCNRYIPNCKVILSQSSNGRFYIYLANLISYT
jgi:hypothetical protein